MTLTQKLVAGVIVVLFLAVVGLTIAVQRQARAAAEARRSAEAADLRAKDLVVAREASERQLRADLAAASTQIRGFAEALAKAQRAAKARPVTVARGSTGPLPVDPKAVVASPDGTPAASICVLRLGDQTAIDVASTELRTEAGNKVLVQAAEASRLDPNGSKVTLFGGEIRADLSQYLTLPDPVRTADRKFGFGVFGVCRINGGCSAGPFVESPILFGHLTLGGGVFAGPGGTGGMAQLLLRF